MTGSSSIRRNEPRKGDGLVPSNSRLSSTRGRGRPLSVAVCILAGGLSSRMGRNKAHVQLGGLTLLQWVRRIARTLGLPTRLIRRDVVPRCGPLGGIYTGLVTSTASAELFLACDMPLIRPALLQEIVEQFQTTGR